MDKIFHINISSLIFIKFILIKGVATEVDGSWDGSLTLKYYTDASFGTELEDGLYLKFRDFDPHVVGMDS